MEQFERILGNERLEDMLDLILAGLLHSAFAAGPEEESEEVEKAVKGKEGLVPVRILRRGKTPHLAIYYINPEKQRPRKTAPHVPSEETQGAISWHQENISSALERQADYYQRRAQQYASPEVQDFARHTLERLLEGDYRVGGDIDRFLRSIGLREEGPTITSGFSLAAFNMLMLSGLHADPQFARISDKLVQSAIDANLSYQDGSKAYEDFWALLGARAETLRSQRQARNATVASALAIVQDEKLQEALRKAQEGVDTALRSRHRQRSVFWVGLGAWAVAHDMMSESDASLHVQRLTESHRRLTSVRRRLLKWELTFHELAAAALQGKSPEEIARMSEKEIHELVEAEYQKRTGKTGFFDIQRKLIAEERSRERTHFRHYANFMLHIIDNHPIYHHLPVSKDAMVDAIKTTLELMDKERRLSAQVRAYARMGSETKRTAAERELAIVRARRAALKSLFGVIAAAHLVGTFHAEAAKKDPLSRRESLAPFWWQIAAAIGTAKKITPKEGEAQWRAQLMSGFDRLADAVRGWEGFSPASHIQAFVSSLKNIAAGGSSDALAELLSPLMRKGQKVNPQVATLIADRASRETLKFLVLAAGGGEHYRLHAEALRQAAKETKNIATMPARLLPTLVGIVAPGI